MSGAVKIGDIGLFFDEAMIAHDPGPGHPERPARLRAIDAYLRAHFPDLLRQAAPPADLDLIKRVHEPDYVDSIASLRGTSAMLDPDTIIGPSSVNAALLAVGQAVAAVDFSLAHKKPAFALVRPPGHHAERERAMGFCIFNNIAVAAAHALTRPDIERVLIVDWDVHHGNGTQNIFYDRDDVLFFSTHQSPFYPGTGAADEIGEGAGEGYTINIPLPAGTRDEEILEIFETTLADAANRFQPDFVLISAGFDAHRLDPIGGMNITTEGFARLLSLVQEIVRKYCAGHLVLVLEGGYEVDELARCVGRCVERVIDF